MADRTDRTMIEFYGGLGVIGGSKIMISTPNARVLLDMGLDIPDGLDLFREPVRRRCGGELADYLNTGQAPELPGIYDPAQLPVQGPRADRSEALAVGDPRPTAIFLSHPHIDHDGMLGFVRAELSCHAHPETVELHRALAISGLGPVGRPVTLQPTPPGTAITVGDIVVEPIEVDHDVPGACGFLISTPDGRIGYTGDFNLHRNGGRRTSAFAERIRGVDALITETTLLSFDPLPAEPITEDEVLTVIGDRLAGPQLQLISAYERDVERAQAIIDLARQRGRTMIWPGQQATFLGLLGVRDVVTWDDSRRQRKAHQIAVANAIAAGTQPTTVGLAEVWDRPSDFLVQTDSADLPSLLDLPISVGTGWLHSQGEPLGPFMSTWQPFMDWLEHLGVEVVPAGSSGHAGPQALIEMVKQIAPGTVYPIHGFRPETAAHLLGAPQTEARTIVPAAGIRYPLR
ncbi:MBL fold metallo-hydrolase [Microlunatus soli]|uniref:Ribonuclease J n=1 Tax=Microlunatus soli TaxID=630515 RepID=A0A1H1QBM4_9ACTN|nr:MBL fold metallo-hydrolase [Microlunatus soli]SDS20921.1 ribonuclease J [Microlunatus soli]